MTNHEIDDELAMIDRGLTTHEVADILGIGDERVRQLEKDGVFPKEGRGSWSLVDTVQGYIKFLRDDERRNAKSAAAARLRDVQAARLEQQMRAEARELVNAGDARFVVNISTEALMIELAEAANRYTSDPIARTRLEGEIADAFNRAGDLVERKLIALETGGDIMEA